MAYKIISNGPNIQSDVLELIADLDADVANLPTEDVGVGSTCIVLESSSVYMFGNDHAWHVL